MSARVLGVTSRIVFCLGGVTTLFSGVPYVMLKGVDLPYEREWIFFVVVLWLVGFLSLAAGVLPRSWIGKVCGLDREDTRLFSAPLKLFVVFAAAAYLVALLAYLAPHRWNLNPQLMFVLCPMYFVKLTFDPSVVAIVFLLAPMNAAVYGAVGTLVAYCLLSFHRNA